MGYLCCSAHFKLDAVKTRTEPKYTYIHANIKHIQLSNLFYLNIHTIWQCSIFDISSVRKPPSNSDKIDSVRKSIP